VRSSDVTFNSALCFQGRVITGPDDHECVADQRSGRDAGDDHRIGVWSSGGQLWRRADWDAGQRADRELEQHANCGYGAAVESVGSGAGRAERGLVELGVVHHAGADDHERDADQWSGRDAGDDHRIGVWSSGGQLWRRADWDAGQRADRELEQHANCGYGAAVESVGSGAGRADGAWSNSVSFTMLGPTITSVTPTSGTVGTQVTITGSGFGAVAGSYGDVQIGTQDNAPIVSWSNTQIVATVPLSSRSGVVQVGQNGAWSNSVPFTMLGPTITSVTPTSGTVGTQVTITGSGFGSVASSYGDVQIGTQDNAPIVSWSDTKIVATVPLSSLSGVVQVAQNGAWSNSVPFTMAGPTITSVTPTSGTVGTQVTITGSGFGSVASSFGDVQIGTQDNAPIVSWSDTKIVATVPLSSLSGVVQVAQNGAWSNSVPFTIGAASDFVATTGTMSSTRYGQTATQLTNGQILIAGGVSNSGVVNSAELYALASQIFAANANPMNVARWLHTATLLNDGTVLIAGGSELANKETLDSAEIYDPVAGTFTLLPSTLNTARVGHTATLLSNGQVLIVGGYDPTTGIISDSELYDPIAQVFIDLGDTNTPRFRHTATLLQNGQVLIAGGEIDPTPSGAYNTAEIFNPQTWVFSPLSVTMISAREGHAATLLNDGTVLITGGDLPPTGSLNTAEIYNATANTFTAVSAAMTSPRIFHDSLLLNGGQVLLSGGETDSGGTSNALNAAELYNPTTQTFTATTGNMTSVREHQTATLLNDGTVLEDGGTDGTNAFNTAEIYTISKLTGLASIAISPTAPSVPLGSQQLLVATGTFNDGSTQVLSSVLWSSSSTGVATVSGDASDSGNVATIAQGTATITATAAGLSGSTIITVPAPTLVSISISPQSAAMPLGTTQQFDAVGTYSDGSSQDLTSTATWTSSSSSATVSSGGLVIAAALGTSAIQASSGSQSSSTTVTVGSPALVSLSVTPTAGTLAVGQSQQYQAIGTYTDGSSQNLTSSVSWYAVPQTSASVNSGGLVTATGQGNVNITAAYGTYSGVSTLMVGPAGLISIAVSPSTASIPVGSNQQFVAVGSYSDGSTQDITSSATWTATGTASSVSATGLATVLAGGSTTITASSGSLTGSAVLTVQTATVALNTSRYEHSATLLNNGSVLIAGGVSCPSAGSCTYLNSAEVYNPSSGTIANTGNMAASRMAPAVPLGNGKVLVAGGYSCDANQNCTSLNSAEIYDPGAGTFSSAGNMTVDRYGHTMTLLSTGKVLIAGGQTCSSATSCTALSTAELYDPIAGTFTATGNLNAARFNAAAVALSSGQVLIAGGFDGTNFPAAAELYDPVAAAFSVTGSLNTPRANSTATLLNNGQVMIGGGSTCSSPGCPTAVTELYNGGSFYYPTYPTGNLNVSRFDQTATLLTNGQVLFAGGYDSCAASCISDGTTEIFDPVAFAFTSSQALSTGRSGHTATLLSDGGVLVVGGINSGVTLSSTDSYQPATLALPGLASIAISPSNPPIALGTTLSLTATGYNSNGSVLNNSQSPLQSVIWNSSSPSVATVSNATGSAGIVNPLSSGTTTITATVGTITASTQVTVTAPLVSIAVSPSNPTLSIGSTQTLQLTATGTYADGSTIDLTSDVTWASSNTPVATVFDISGSPAVVVPSSSGNTNITAAFGGVTGSTTVTVNMPLAPAPPMVTGVSPPNGAPGTQVTITGSGFGPTKGSGAVWLGTGMGTVVSWSDSLVVATVSTGSSSGVAQIQQSDGASNSVPFAINTAAVTGVSPNNGLAGTQVAITGSGFGATQGNGNVWLGTVPAIVDSWSDGQIIATVATGAATANALVLQNGVMSNAVPFTIYLPHITSISPNNGAAGTVVTVTGSGFGASQGSGTVWIGSSFGSVLGWSDTQVVASVAANAVSGIAKIEQNGTWSNGTTFTVGSGGGGSGGGGSFGGSNSVTLVPNQMNMLTGGTQQIQALNSSGQSMTGLTWTSSNTAVATLSTDDPPIITAVAPGNATITAGNASADVTVVPGAVLATGTVIWSNPGDGSGVSCIVPAVPSSTGVADVFALQVSGNVQAITSSGMTAWTASVGTNFTCSNLIPDFQGGLVVANQQSIYRLDGMTGQAYPAYQSTGYNSGHGLSTPVVHTDGTIFAVDSGDMLVAINPTSGQPNFQVHMDDSSGQVSGNCGDTPLPQGGQSSSPPSPPSVGSMIIAGDGYAYVPYLYQEISGSRGIDNGECAGASTETQHLRLLRAGTGGDSSSIPLGDWYSFEFSSGFNINSKSVSVSLPSLITNVDQGVLASWEVDTIEEVDVQTQSGISSSSSSASSFSLATTSGSSVTSNVQVTSVPGQVAPVQPILQRADSSYIGTVGIGLLPGRVTQSNMIAFTSSGTTLWTQPNETPQIATAGGGVIGSSGTTYDQNGNVTGQLGSLNTYSWTGRSYQIGSTELVADTTPNYDESNAATAGGNPASPSNYFKHVGEVYRATIASTAFSYIGDIWYPTQAYPDPLEECNVFLGDMLKDVGNQLVQQDKPLQTLNDIKPPIKYVAASKQLPWLPARWVYVGAADWFNLSFPEGAPLPGNNGPVIGEVAGGANCWTSVSGGPDGAQPGDILATHSHVGIVYAQGQLISAADPTLQRLVIPGTVTDSNYGWRITDPNGLGLKSQSHVKRFTCF